MSKCRTEYVEIEKPIKSAMALVTLFEASHFLKGTSSFRTFAYYTEEMGKRNA